MRYSQASKIKNQQNYKDNELIDLPRWKGTQRLENSLFILTGCLGGILEGCNLSLECVTWNKNLGENVV